MVSFRGMFFRGNVSREYGSSLYPWNFRRAVSYAFREPARQRPVFSDGQRPVGIAKPGDRVYIVSGGEDFSR